MVPPVAFLLAPAFAHSSSTMGLRSKSSSTAFLCIPAGAPYSKFVGRARYSVTHEPLTSLVLSDQADRGHRAPLDVARLCVDSPFDETVDIGRSAFNFAAVRRQLLSTYTILAEPSAVSLSDLTPHDTPPVHGLTTKTRQTG